MANKERMNIRSLFGEIVDKSLYEDELIETVDLMKKKGKGVYELEATKAAMSPEKDKYIFITLYKGHASIVVIDKELFNTLLFPPVFGQMVDGSTLNYRTDFDTSRLLQTPLQQYHIILGENAKYMLSRNMYYMPWFMKSRSFFVGETAMDYFYLQMLCLMVVPEKYRLVLDDCLEFAKRFATEVAVEENGVRKTEMKVLFQTLVVSEDYSTALLEGSSRRNPKSALTAALSYCLSFKIERLCIALLVIVISIITLQYINNIP